MILAAKGKDKESRKQLKQGFEKKIYIYFSLHFCQFSSNMSYTLALGLKEVYIVSSTWGPKMSNNNIEDRKELEVTEKVGCTFPKKSLNNQH